MIALNSINKDLVNISNNPYFTVMEERKVKSRTENTIRQRVKEANII